MPIILGVCFLVIGLVTHYIENARFVRLAKRLGLDWLIEVVASKSGLRTKALGPGEIFVGITLIVLGSLGTI